MRRYWMSLGLVLSLSLPSTATLAAPADPEAAWSVPLSGWELPDLAARLGSYWRELVALLDKSGSQMDPSGTPNGGGTTTTTTTGGTGGDSGSSSGGGAAGGSGSGG
ncbi:MAG TPA: hypothetical protein PK413_19745 [Thermoanaerobaculia bacterium]|nr:hypothetical protein [Thermoanaerobaculia bacterium]